jgi:RES domain-containing protein
MQPVRRDSALIDAVESLSGSAFSGTLWRVVREGRDPCACSTAGGRWDDATFDVLYTSLERDGAIAELYFHLAQGQPVFPTKVRYFLFELQAKLESAVDLSDRALLSSLGVNMTRFGQLSYFERKGEYPRTQEVAEVAHFLEHQGIVVPSARWQCNNVVLFCDHLRPGAVEVVNDHGLVDWKAWTSVNGRFLPQ